jgi:hypothetical protein
MSWLKRIFGGRIGTVTQAVGGSAGSRFENDFLAVELPGSWKWKRYMPVRGAGATPQAISGYDDIDYKQLTIPAFLRIGHFSIQETPKEITEARLLHSTTFIGQNQAERGAQITILPLRHDPLVRPLDYQGRQTFLTAKAKQCTLQPSDDVRSQQRRSELGVSWTECIFTSGSGCWHLFRAVITTKVVIDFNYDAFNVVHQEFTIETERMLKSLTWK